MQPRDQRIEEPANRATVVRWQWLWLFAAPAVIGSVFLGWGDKHIEDLECTPTWDDQTWESGMHCSSDEWQVSYRPFSFQTTHTDHHTVGFPGLAKEWAYHYSDEEAPHAEGIGPLLKFGGAGLIIGVGALVFTGVGHQIAQLPTTLLGARVGWSLYAGSVASFCLGMAYHAGTWRAEEVDNLVPGWGLLFALVPLLAGVPLLPQRDRMQGLPVLPSLE